MFYLFGTNKRIGIVRNKNISSCVSRVSAVVFVTGIHVLGISACAPIKWADDSFASERGAKTLFVFVSSDRSSDIPQETDKHIPSRELTADLAPETNYEEIKSGGSQRESQIHAVRTVDEVAEQYSVMRVKEVAKEIGALEINSAKMKSVEVVSSNHSEADRMDSEVEMGSQIGVETATLLSDDLEENEADLSTALAVVVDKAAILAGEVYNEIVSLVSSNDKIDDAAITAEASSISEKSISEKIEVISESEMFKGELHNDHSGVNVLVAEESGTSATPKEISVTRISDPNIPSDNRVAIDEYENLVNEETQKSALNAKGLNNETLEDTSNDLVIDKINQMTASFATAAGGEKIVKSDSRNQEFLPSLRKAVAPEKVKPFSLSEENELSWQLVKFDSIQKACKLVSPTIQLESKNYTTQVWFEVAKEAIQINTTTNLNPLHENLGVRFDNGPLMKFSSMPFANKVLWVGDLESVIMENSALRVYLGGNEIGTSIPELMISLSDLQRHYPEYSGCNSYQLSQAGM